MLLFKIPPLVCCLKKSVCRLVWTMNCGCGCKIREYTPLWTGVCWRFGTRTANGLVFTLLVAPKQSTFLVEFHMERQHKHPRCWPLSPTHSHTDSVPFLLSPSPFAHQLLSRTPARQNKNAPLFFSSLNSVVIQFSLLPTSHNYIYCSHFLRQTTARTTRRNDTN